MSVQIEDGVVKIDGELRIRQIVEIFNELNGALGHGSPMTIDLSQIKKIDCAGLQLLCHLKKRSKVENFELNLINPSDEVTNTLNFVQMSDFLGVSQVH